MVLTKYETFLEVVKTGSMSKAAYNLHQTVPGISYGITKLEEEWGIPLFIRNKNKLVLTEEGEELASYVSEVLGAQERLEQAVLSIKGIEKGTVRVGGLRLANQQWLPGIMTMMKEKYPNINIKIVLNLYEEVKKDLMEGTLDVAFGAEPTSKMLGFDYLLDDPYVAVLKKGHPLAALSQVTLDQLTKETLILPDWNYDKNLNALIDKSRIRDQVDYFIKDAGTIVAMASHGIGVGILPRLILTDNTKDVDFVPLKEWPVRKVGLVTSALKKPSPAAKKFIQCTREWFKIFFNS